MWTEMWTNLSFDIMHIIRTQNNSVGSPAGPSMRPADQRRGASVGGVMPIET